MTAEDLYKNNEKIAYAALNRYMPNYKLDEDYMQVAKLGLWKACLSFDESKGYTFSTYAYTIIRNELFIQRHKILKERNLGEIIPLDAIVGDDLGDTSFHELIEDKSIPDICTLIDSEINTEGFSERQNEILQLRLEGYGLAEIADKIGVSRQRIYNIMKEMQLIVKYSQETGKTLTRPEFKRIKKYKKLADKTEETSYTKKQK